MAQLTEKQIKLVNILENFYQPAGLGCTPLLYTTADIFRRIQSVWPSDEYEPTDVYVIMIYLKYEYINSTANKLCWMMQERASDRS